MVQKKVKVMTMRDKNIKLNVSPRQMEEAAIASLIEGIEILQKLLPKLPKKGIKRVLLAGLQLPDEDLPSDLKDSLEEDAYNIVQRVINARIMIFNYAMYKQMKTEEAIEENIESIAEDAKKEIENGD